MGFDKLYGDGIHVHDDVKKGKERGDAAAEISTCVDGPSPRL